MGWDPEAAACDSVGPWAEPGTQSPLTVRYGAVWLSGSVLQVCRRRLVFMCTSCKAFQVAGKLWNKKAVLSQLLLFFIR